MFFSIITNSFFSNELNGEASNANAYVTVLLISLYYYNGDKGLCWR